MRRPTEGAPQRPTAMRPESTKAQIARRVIEVFDFLDRKGQPASATEIIRYYGRPQSSMSELLGMLVELGLLYKDEASRTYLPSPRLAALGSLAQPDFIRDGRLFNFMDKLAERSRHSVALFGIVGTRVQIFRLAVGAFAIGGDFVLGSNELMYSCVAGKLLLSTLSSDDLRRMRHKLSASISEEAIPFELLTPEALVELRHHGHVTGALGFGVEAQLTAIIVPCPPPQRALAMGFVYPAESAVDTHVLVAMLKEGLATCDLTETARNLKQ